jgi:spermidine synthase
MTNNLKKILSYLMPLRIESGSTGYNKYLEVLLNNGQYMLNAENVNYSFGSLHAIFKKTFQDINIEAINISNCLLLGLGGGSVINLLQKKHKLTFPLTAVEIDPEVIRLGKKYFDLDNYKKLTILNEDAFTFIKNNRFSYDLIIVDLYINNIVPEIFHSQQFITALKKASHGNTILLFNKMLGSKLAESEFNTLVQEMSRAFGTVSFLSYYINGTENKIICVNVSRIVEKNKQLPGNVNSDVILSAT